MGITAGDAQELFVSPGWMRARGLAGENRSFGRITSQISCLQCLLQPPEWLIQWQSMLPPACINPCSSVALTPSFALMLCCSRSAATAMRPPRKTLSPRSPDDLLPLSIWADAYTACSPVALVLSCYLAPQSSRQFLD
ncbi:hypothetical protein AKAW_00157 [Aspergillus luchuensis IFO 4308]|nr:hypothetical protein AKAW_00157 [Aspergillus luchuensis IFO 4308]